ncbi:MAG: hypothetical protein WC879_06115 [Melioribacteraceae bacterium]
MAGGGSISFREKMTLNFNGLLPNDIGYEPVPRLYGREDALKYRNLNDINMTMSGCAFLKSAWQAVNGLWDFERRVCSYDDRDFQMRVSTLFDVAVVDEPTAFYRINSSLQRAQNV